MRRATFLLCLSAAVAAAPFIAARFADAQSIGDVSVQAAPGVWVELRDVDVAARDAEMRTPLHRAAAAVADGDLIRAMIDRGADPNARDVEGRTPLHAAAAAGAPLTVVAALLGGGADARATDVAGLTPLHMAAGPDVAAILAIGGADPCALDAFGWPALDAETLERIRQEAPSLYDAAKAAFLNCL